MVRFNRKDLPEREQLLNGMAEISEDDDFRPLDKGEFMCLNSTKRLIKLRHLLGIVII